MIRTQFHYFIKSEGNEFNFIIISHFFLCSSIKLSTHCYDLDTSLLFIYLYEHANILSYVSDILKNIYELFSVQSAKKKHIKTVYI